MDSRIINQKLNNKNNFIIFSLGANYKYRQFNC